MASATGFVKLNRISALLIYDRRAPFSLGFQHLTLIDPRLLGVALHQINYLLPDHHEHHEHLPHLSW